VEGNPAQPGLRPDAPVQSISTARSASHAVRLALPITGRVRSDNVAAN